MVGSVPFAFGKCLFELSNFPREKEREREKKNRHNIIHSTIGKTPAAPTQGLLCIVKNDPA